MPDNNLKILKTCQFKTKRTVVRGWDCQPENLGQLHRELSQLLTPAVTEFLPEPLKLGSGRISSWVDARNRESQVFAIRARETAEGNGGGKSTQALWGLLIVVVLKRQGMEPAEISPSGLKDDRDHLEIRLGYLVSEKVWGKGLATEVVQGLVNWCREQQLSGHLIGGVEKNNPASAAVLTKAGFVRVADAVKDQTLSQDDTESFALRL